MRSSSSSSVVMDAKKQEREAHARWREGFEAQQQRAERKRAHASRRERRSHS
jgi:hypothetical protein